MACCRDGRHDSGAKRAIRVKSAATPSVAASGRWRRAHAIGRRAPQRLDKAGAIAYRAAMLRATPQATSSPYASPRMLALVFLGNTLIALVLWLGGIDEGFGNLWASSQCIGFGIMFCHCTARRLARDRRGAGWWPAFGVVAGSLGGLAAAFLLGFFPGIIPATDWLILLRVGLMVLIIGAIAHAFFSNVQHLGELKIAQQAAQLNELARQKETATAHLKLLQAQIEPHFLFNTLANLHSLIGSNDALARHLLERLNDYLRASLDHSRSASGTLGDECRLLAAYLDIQALRMGQRLSWTIDVGQPLLAYPLPPMLLQPLVENAIRHGIEPRVGPGRVTLAARCVDQRLCLTVSDDGRGLAATPKPTDNRHGVGLNNVRERLAALYGGDAELVLRPNIPTGVIAELWIPLPAPAR